MTNYVAFLWRNQRFLAYGLLVAFFSSFGQTYFISIFGPVIRADFGLNHGSFGALYAIGTTASAVCLIWAGKLIDRMDLRRFTLALVLALAAACAIMGLSPVAGALAIGIFALRLTGQGLMSHTAMTSMARYFEAERGRAVSFAMLGFPLGVAVFPLAGLFLIETVGWREAWLWMAGGIVALLAPLLLWLLRGHALRHQRFIERETASAAATDGTAGHRRHWTRGEVLRDPRFYMLIPALMAPAFIVTGFFFHQSPLADAKGWSAAWMASAFVGYSVGSVGGSLIMGFVVDRFGGLRILPTYLLPLAAACAVIAATDAPLAAFAFTILMGLTSGGGQTLMGTVWAEFYGVLHLGAIRSMTMACGVVASAASPLLLGVLIDWHIGIEAIALGCLTYAVSGCGLILLAIRQRVPEAHPA